MGAGYLFALLRPPTLPLVHLIMVKVDASSSWDPNYHLGGESPHDAHAPDSPAGRLGKACCRKTTAIHGIQVTSIY